MLVQLGNETELPIGPPEAQQVYWQADYWLANTHLTAWAKARKHYTQISYDAYVLSQHRNYLSKRVHAKANLTNVTSHTVKHS